MKLFGFFFLICIGITSCKSYTKIKDKNFVLIEDTYINDTLHLKDFVFCGTYYNLRHSNLYKNHPLPYAIEDIVDLIVKNINNQTFVPFVVDIVENKFSYYLCSNRFAPRNNKRTLEELKFLFPQKDNKVRIVPHLNFVKRFSVGKTMSPLGFYDESIQLKQTVVLVFYLIKNTEIIYMNNIYLIHNQRSVEDKNDDSFPFFDLEKIDEIIGEVLKDYFERVES
jgi:hypothetical protein